MAGLYTGPIIDAHHHLWDLSLGRHRWLTEPDASLAALGDISFMRHTYLPADYEESARLLGSGAVRTADFVTATRPLDQVAEAFELAYSGDHVKVLVTVGER